MATLIPVCPWDQELEGKMELSIHLPNLLSVFEAIVANLKSPPEGNQAVDWGHFHQAQLVDSCVPSLHNS